MHKKLNKFLPSFAVAVAVLTATVIPASAAGNVAQAIEGTWTAAQGQIQTVVNNVVFPVIDMILAIMFFVKLGTAYFDCAPVTAM